ncbi:hypothetical protein JCM14076_20810 [Methylosoma difficile]
MTEILFVLTTVYVAYVAYSVFNSSQTGDTATHHASPDVQAVAAEPEAIVNVDVKDAVAKMEEPVAKMEEPVAPPPVEKTAPTAAPKAAKPKVIAPTPSSAKGTVRDPKTGEVSSIVANYRFTKRWIKDAMVIEGLLPKVYKNNELDAETEVLIKEAMAKLEAMDKYQG